MLLSASKLWTSRHYLEMGDMEVVTNIHRQNQTTAVRNARNFTSGSGDSPVNVLETGIFVKTKIEI